MILKLVSAVSSMGILVFRVIMFQDFNITSILVPLWKGNILYSVEQNQILNSVDFCITLNISLILQELFRKTLSKVQSYFLKSFKTFLKNEKIFLFNQFTASFIHTFIKFHPYGYHLQFLSSISNFHVWRTSVVSQDLGNFVQ